jgi:hypothetical protein
VSQFNLTPNALLFGNKDGDGLTIAMLNRTLITRGLIIDLAQRLKFSGAVAARQVITLGLARVDGNLGECYGNQTQYN